MLDEADEANRRGQCPLTREWVREMDQVNMANRKIIEGQRINLLLKAWDK